MTVRGIAVVRDCPYCGGSGDCPGLSKYRQRKPTRCPVCYGKGRTAHRWDGDEFVPLDPDEVEQLEMT